VDGLQKAHQHGPGAVAAGGLLFMDPGAAGNPWGRGLGRKGPFVGGYAGVAEKSHGEGWMFRIRSGR